jgi:hypothetical protein
MMGVHVWSSQASVFIIVLVWHSECPFVFYLPRPLAFFYSRVPNIGGGTVVCCDRLEDPKRKESKSDISFFDLVNWLTDWLDPTGFTFSFQDLEVAHTHQIGKQGSTKRCEQKFMEVSSKWPFLHYRSLQVMAGVLLGWSGHTMCRGEQILVF